MSPYLAAPKCKLARMVDLRPPESHEIEWDIVARELESPLRSFHDDFVQALQPSFLEFSAKRSMLHADQLHLFLARHFSGLQTNKEYTRHVLETIQDMRMEPPVHMTYESDPPVSHQYITFMELKATLLLPTMIAQRLDACDPYALEGSVQMSLPPPRASAPPRVALPSAKNEWHEFQFEIQRSNEFHMDVSKRSRQWLGGSQRPRILVLKDGILDIFKKADKTKPKPKASKSICLDHIDALSTGSGHTFIVRTKDGRNVTLSCHSAESLTHCVAEIATHCLFHVLDTGQPPAELAKFVTAGARLNDAMRLLPSLQKVGLVSFPVVPLCAAFVLDGLDKKSSPETRVAILLKAGARPDALLRWAFASHFFLRKTPVSTNVLDFFLRHKLPLWTAGDDAAHWSLLQYLCLVRDVASVERFVRHATAADLARALQHVNAAGDSVLHVAVKRIHEQDKDDDAERIACLLLKAIAKHTTEHPWLHQADAGGESLLHMALKARMWKLLDHLLAMVSSSTGCSDSSGFSVLHLAIRLHAPIKIVARLIQLCKTKRNSSKKKDVDGLELRDDDGADTPLTLAIKCRNEAVVQELLAAGAQPDAVSDWGATLVRSPVTPTDTPLHVAIKTGLPAAARALVLHGASWLTLDGVGSSPLSLALRYGMYALVYELLHVVSGDLGELEWTDRHVGDSVVGLALKAGQLELACLLLDLSPEVVHVQHLRTNESPLHYAMKIRVWLEYLEPKSQKYKKTRQARVKSKSDGDLSTLLTGDWAAPSYDLQSHFFVQRALEGLLLGLLKRVPPSLVVLRTERDPMAPGEPIFHLFNSDDCITDHQVDAFTPLHAAARGGASTNHILRWLLLHIKHCRFRDTLGVTIGFDETPLHVAIEAGAVENALDLLRVLGSGIEDDGAAFVRDAVRRDQASALHLACQSPDANAAVIAELLVQGAYAEGWDEHGDAPLHVAVAHGASSTIVYTMARLGVDMNARTEDGRTPLMVALCANNDSAFDALVKLGANTRAVVPGTRHGLAELGAAMEALSPSIAHTLLDDVRAYARPDVLQQIADASECFASDQVPGDVLRPTYRTQGSIGSKNEFSITRLSLTADAAPVLPPPPMPLSSSSKTALPLKKWIETASTVRSPDELVEHAPSTSTNATKVVKKEQLWWLRLKDEEKSTLQLVANEAKLAAREWLLKRIGKKKMLSDSLVLCQQYYAEKGIDLDPVLARKEAEKNFVDKHVAEAVSDARMEIEREKQMIAHEATRRVAKDPLSNTSAVSFAATSATSSFLVESFLLENLETDDEVDDDVAIYSDVFEWNLDARNTLC
ncbi:hypothetical protein SDRG_05407 [Saprolegnia diclina VS20]|uniref:Uncharacterized protein n=1 Tax=Saprolegnia diclina (strain VS20) TaxID=1156394 RepID=T0QQZ9_SAPDV|nr:hypothetical protein SDRG_05407 [Saprolegnia diclina VS20]EQC37181.1 hypothetical protein SDRG_05407 [Saprolegnia diclina VS20]|eukprot:XP_008609343.1 hypothetical protein SDRG_05407 [Saprolegnia diclina VS20]